MRTLLSTRVAAAFIVALTLPLPAHAADFHVDSTLDKHDHVPGNGVCAARIRGPACTLRAAIEEANALPGLDRIYVPEASYVLALGQLDVTSSMNVYGEGAPVVDAGGNSRVFFFGGAEGGSIAVYVRSLTITNGDTSHAGGGAYVAAGVNLQLYECTVSHNRSLLVGSGLYNFGYLRLRRSLVSDNENTSGSDGGGVTARGGGVYNAAGAEVRVERSSIVRNFSVRAGGLGNQGVAYLSDSTISQNRAINYGGGIVNWPIDGGTSVMEIERCTITENEIDGNGSDPHIGGGGIANFDSLWMYTTLLAGNVDHHLNPSVPYAPDCANFGGATITSSGHNLVGVADGCGIAPDPSEILGTAASPIAPGLGPLAPWTPGGTELHVLLPSSPALHAGPRCQLPDNPNTPIPNCYLADQRGYSRANGSPLEIDIGAYEADGTPPVRVAP